MSVETASPIAAWESFYVIIGSSAGALTGLQFVVIALIAESKARTGMQLIRAFATPTIVHFCAVLLIAAILSAPWSTLSSPGFAVGACGVAGLAYGATVLKRTRRQTGYTPVLADWLWHGVLPLIAYATLLVAAVLLITRRPASPLFAIGASTVVLLFVGIHNAWDAVTYIVVERPKA
ncbi:MAG TPA: hypothetical protein VE422_06490 [Terriglobia bacterium]|nr:hypothetical protein [Terriglobia bacterium]